jgi:hypothetical protein
MKARILAVLSIFARVAVLGTDQNVPPGEPLKAALVAQSYSDPTHLEQLTKDGYNAIVLYLDDGASAEAKKAAAQRILSAKLPLYYWIEIARNPAMADAHPEWIASIQTHPEWRRRFPNFPQPATNEVVKNYPWVPVLYQETFEPHRARVEALLRGLPAPEGLFLNDLQGAPSACGCGNSYCRWTTDYGPKRTATRLPNDAAAQFVAAVAKLVPQAKIIPVWTTECLEKDGPKDAPCAGVGCFTGKCWHEYTAQLMPIAERCENVGVLLPFHAFENERSAYGNSAEWQKDAVRSFIEMPPKRGGEALSLNRLIAVVQGWDVTLEQQALQIKQLHEAGVGGYVVALTKTDQAWQPRLLKVSQSQSSAPDQPHAH